MDYIGTIEQDKGLGQEKQIIIYGAGKVGRHTLEVLEKTDQKEKIVCFCDNDKSMEEKYIEGIPVYGVEKVCTVYPYGTYLIASMFVRQMVESLLQYGIEKIHIIRETLMEEEDF